MDNGGTLENSSSMFALISFRSTAVSTTVGVIMTRVSLRVVALVLDPNKGPISGTRLR
jgi:hypothetical protein